MSSINCASTHRAERFLPPSSDATACDPHVSSAFERTELTSANMETTSISLALKFSTKDLLRSKRGIATCKLLSAQRKMSVARRKDSLAEVPSCPEATQCQDTIGQLDAHSFHSGIRTTTV